MAKSATSCLGGVALIASLALNVALITGCISIDSEAPFIHLSKKKPEPDHSQCEAMLRKEQEASFKRLCDIADAIGLEVKADATEVSLKGEIVRRLLVAKVQLPAGELGEADLARIDERLMTNKAAVKEACSFVMKLKGKKVLVLGADGK